MDLNYSTINLFPSLLHVFDVDGFSLIENELIDYAYNLKEREQSKISSNVGGWQSPNFDVKNHDDPLHYFLLNSLAICPVIKNNNMNIIAWININEPDAYNIKHDHPESDLAGVLWIKAHKDSGNIVFDNPNAFQSHTEINSYITEFRNKYYCNHAYSFPPVKGKMLVFPSHILHRVDQNKSNEDRISVSFNIRLKNE